MRLIKEILSHAQRALNRRTERKIERSLKHHLTLLEEKKNARK